MFPLMGKCESSLTQFHVYLLNGTYVIILARRWVYRDEQSWDSIFWRMERNNFNTTQY